MDESKISTRILRIAFHGYNTYQFRELIAGLGMEMAVLGVLVEPDDDDVPATTTMCGGGLVEGELVDLDGE